MLSLFGSEIRFTHNKPEYLVIFIHGYGADGYNLLPLAEEFKDVFPDALFCAPNAPFKLEMSNFGYQWFSLVDRSINKMLEGLDEAVKYLDTYINHQLKYYNISKDKVILIGFSQGTMLSLHYNLTINDNVNCLIGYSGKFIYNSNREYSQTNTPIILIHGDKDDIIPIDDHYRSMEYLNEIGIKADNYICKNLPHSINTEGIDIAKEFIKMNI